MKRSEALEHRIHAQQLDRPEAERAITDAAVFDFGVQDTGRDGASWALANRGVSVRDAEELEASPDVALAWTLRAAPHYYRRTDLPGVLIATSPLSDRDAAKRVIGADKPLREAGISTLAGLTEVATQMRRVVTRPMVKGEVSTQLTALLDAPYLRYCGACKATHSWEVPFRIGALYAGLELEPGTSPPVLRRIPGWPKRSPGPAPDPMATPERLQPIRNYLRFLGPATPNDVAAFLDSPVAEIKAHWPKDAVEVSVDGRQGWIVGEIGGIEHDRALLRLLGGFDLFLQGKDRDLIVPDTSRHKELWPILGRPGAVLSGSELVGSWRPKTAGNGFTLRLSLWTTLSKRIRNQLELEAQRLAAHRGLALAAIVEE
ncbi:MAG TPA: crosslink repair DNA glycosylase YcaQ family protein [Propionibacteriaceae bacterium]|nr:crosslink repair DNA glycosylase YcaQ family protein [Propionibacteriaceae bacterium]